MESGSMQRLKARWVPPVLALVMAVLVIEAGVADASEQRPGRGWRSSRYGRKGAEIWAEFPRFAFPEGVGYRDEFDSNEGLGFGFGLMWGISDNIAFEGRILQTNHTVDFEGEEKEWHLDLIKVGARYTFLERLRLQPFVGAGWAKLTYEQATDYASSDPFNRLTGYGSYVTVGVDYIHNSAWSAFFRADYTLGGYSHHTVGVEEEKLAKPLSGNCGSVTLGIAYRIPAW
jgi:hypothetical protein